MRAEERAREGRALCGHVSRAGSDSDEDLEKHKGSRQQRPKDTEDAQPPRQAEAPCRRAGCRPCGCVRACVKESRGPWLKSQWHDAVS